MKKKKIDFWTIIIFCAIYFSHESMIFGQNINENFNFVGKIFPLILCFIIGIAFRKQHLKKRLVYFSLLIILIPFVSCFINNEDIYNYISLASLITLSCLILSFLGLDGFRKRFINIILFLSAFSLFSWFTGLLLPEMVKKLPYFINNNNIKFYNFVFSLVDFSGNSLILRNCGIFREQGVFVVYIVTALLFLITERQINKNKVIILVITLVSTLSTAGFIILAFLALLLLFGNISHHQRNKLLLLYLIIIIALVVVSQFTSVNLSVFSKFNSANNSYGSFFARFSSVTGNIRIAFENPLFGVGKAHIYTMVLGTSGSDNRFIAIDNTNTLLMGFASFGLFFGILTTYGFISHCIQYRLSIKLTILPIIILFAAFSNEDFTQNFLWYVIILSGYKKTTSLNCNRSKLKYV